MMRGWAALLLLVPAVQEDVRPHIIVVLADDLGPGDLGEDTPRLERMAAEGRRFARYYSASPICSPSRAGLLTGTFPGRHRITSYLQARKGNLGCGQADFLAPSARTLPGILKASGYATLHAGKWHLGGGRDVDDAPKFAAYGYDEAVSTWESPEPHPDLTAANWIWSPKDKVKRWERNDFFVEKTLDFLRRRGGRPCFVNLWPDDPHTPWVPGPEAPKGEREENLQAVLRGLDRAVGKLLDGLRDLGIEKRTLVVFTSDNGPLPTFEGRRTGGLRGSKLSLYEGGIRMPFLARWPGRIPEGKTDDTTVLGAVDLLPTLCAVAGAAPPPGDGQDLVGALLGTPAVRAAPLFWEYGRNDEHFKYPAGRDRSPNLAVLDGAWKLLVKDDGTGAELYALDDDPRESKNLATARADVAARLTKAALDWRRSLP
jgi:arylsulfatase A-like enzyme